MREDLYEIDAGDVELTKFCGGGITDTMESCVAAARLPGSEDAFIIGDSKLGSGSPTLRFNKTELDNFIEAYQAGQVG